MMRKGKFPIHKVIQILAEASLPGNTVASVCRKYQISEQTFYRWRSKYGGLNASEAKRLKVLEEENNMLKKLLAEKELELQTLREVIKKTFNKGG